MARRLLDLVLVLVVGGAVVFAVYTGVRATERRPSLGARPRGLPPHGDLAGAARGARKGIDPYKPPGLPAGASIDRTTGFMLGLDLRVGPGQHAPTWASLAAGNGVTRVQDLPASIRALDGKPVVLAGFLYVLYSLRKIREFALVGSHTKCCFGVPLDVGDQVIVKLDRNQPDAPLTLAPLRVEGTFRLRPQNLHEDGTGPLIWLYEVVGARVVSYGE